MITVRGEDWQLEAVAEELRTSWLTMDALNGKKAALR
jgi:hypothetical protein